MNVEEEFPTLVRPNHVVCMDGSLVGCSLFCWTPRTYADHAQACFSSVLYYTRSYCVGKATCIFIVVRAETVRGVLPVRRSFGLLHLRLVQVKMYWASVATIVAQFYFVVFPKPNGSARQDEAPNKDRRSNTLNSGPEAHCCPCASILQQRGYTNFF